MNERRIGLEKVNVSVEPAEDGRRPKLALEASNIRTGSGRRGSGVDMCSKEKPVNITGTSTLHTIRYSKFSRVYCLYPYFGDRTLEDWGVAAGIEFRFPIAHFSY